MTERMQAIAAQKERLDKLRPLSREALERLERYYDIELTYTSNAIEGNNNASDRAGRDHRRQTSQRSLDGNGRTARILMNLILIRGGSPPLAVRPEGRPAYIHALQEAQAGLGTASFHALLYERLEGTLGEYLAALAS